MKTISKIFLLALVIGLASCSKSNDDNPDPSGNNNSNSISGDWKVTYYFDSGKDETGDYSGYAFKFNENGVLTASASTSAYSGTWSVNDNSDDDNSSSRMVIMITGNKAMDDLQDDWVIEKMNGTEIWLKDDNVTSNELLRFGRK